MDQTLDNVNGSYSSLVYIIAIESKTDRWV